MKLYLHLHVGDPLGPSTCRASVGTSEEWNKTTEIDHAYGVSEKDAIENLKDFIHRAMEKRVRRDTEVLKFLVEQK